ncbi:protein-disulfide reductase DsbD domain-containing protein [Portibacter marinus]|uniref:protein-disulfide reductase DsbD domain-containing protein n=1 Tax=Portibacter marinus TaxID=2898660 RepID=UPI001F374BAC|nr:protein-disulfide reductase DsbD domain-containing protein [Portibacter marinus]
MRAFAILLIFGFFGNANGQSDMPDPVKWTFEVEKVSENEYKLLYKADIEQGWAIYSQHIEEGGPIPTSFTIEEQDGVELVGAVVEPAEVEKKFDDIFEMDLIKINGPAIFYQMVKTTTSAPTIKGFLTYMSCDDSKCLPPTDVDFEFVVQ